jgi:inner membrane protein
VAFIYFRKNTICRKKIWKLGLGISAIYLLICIGIKTKINGDVKTILQKQQINYTRYFTTPAPLQSLLWYVVAGNDSGYYVGFRSIFDSKEQIDFQYFPRNENLLDSIKDHEDLHKLIRFSQEFYTVENLHDTLLFNDLRFGQIIGWQNPIEKFVFHYYLQHPNDNILVVQRGRFEGWNSGTFLALLKRIKGN